EDDDGAEFAAEGVDGLDAVHAGQAEVHYDEVGAVGAVGFDGFFAFLDFGDEFDVRFELGGGDQAHADEDLVFDQNDADFFLWLGGHGLFFKGKLDAKMKV